MTDPGDRFWNVRDAVLKWFHLKAMLDRDRHPFVDAAAIAAAVGCQGGPMTSDEVDAAHRWLLEHGYLCCPGWRHGTRRPSLTAKGEAVAASNKTVRGGDRDAYIAIADPGAIRTHTPTVH
jgi:hypothetical protein